MFLLPDILSQILHLACHDVHMFQEAFLDSPMSPPTPSKVVRAPLQGHEYLHCGTQSCQRGLSTHQMIRTPRATNWVQFTTIQCSAGSLDPIGTLFILQIFTKHRVAQKTEQGLPLKSYSHKKRTVNPPLSCSYPIKSNWHRVQPGGDTGSKRLPHSVLQGRKQSVAKETSGTEKKYLIQSFLIPR